MAILRMDVGVRCFREETCNPKRPKSASVFLRYELNVLRCTFSKSRCELIVLRTAILILLRDKYRQVYRAKFTWISWAKHVWVSLSVEVY